MAVDEEGRKEAGTEEVKFIASILILGLAACSRPAPVLSNWKPFAWRYSPHGKDCAEVLALPVKIYQVEILDKDGTGRIVFAGQIQFDSDSEMKTFVEKVCASR